MIVSSFIDLLGEWVTEFVVGGIHSIGTFLLIAIDAASVVFTMQNWLKSDTALLDLTAIMQSPLSVRCFLVISNVVLCVDLMSSCPYAEINSVFSMLLHSLMNIRLRRFLFHPVHCPRLVIWTCRILGYLSHINLNSLP